MTQPKQPIKHIDRLGRSIDLGSIVAYASSNTLEIGKVVKLNPKMIKILPLAARGRRVSETNKYPSETVVLEGADVSMYLLKHAAAK